MSEDPELEFTPTDHAMNRAAHALVEMHRGVCADLRLSPWEFILAMANASAWILADSPGMPQGHALTRIRGLRKVMKAAYLERKHGHGSGVVQ